MPRPKRVSITGVSTSNVIPLNYRAPNPEASFIANVTGTATYKVKLTGDDVQAIGYTAGSGKWIDHSTMTGLTASATANLDKPATAIQLEITSGTGTVALDILESGF